MHIFHQKNQSCFNIKIGTLILAILLIPIQKINAGNGPSTNQEANSLQKLQHREYTLLYRKEPTQATAPVKTVGVFMKGQEVSTDFVWSVNPENSGLRFERVTVLGNNLKKKMAHCIDFMTYIPLILLPHYPELSLNLIKIEPKHNAVMLAWLLTKQSLWQRAQDKHPKKMWTITREKLLDYRRREKQKSPGKATKKLDALLRQAF